MTPQYLHVSSSFKFASLIFFLCLKWIFDVLLVASAAAAAGGLVKKILETKKEYEVSPSSSKSKVQVRAFVAAGTIATRGQYEPSQQLPHIYRLYLDSPSAVPRRASV